ncbi:TetR/AcrR family transcriptional regulator [Uliginosibacterium flavum]|uniref:TetR/AcrR family transcriptional regulator n=1 Tax=Uliginosibacterium flavum TaxID=1396831 RepID=A0ABV2TGY1_9RHOO
MSALPTPARQRRKDARPAELLAAALDVFVEKGFAATRMEDIARRAGVSKGTVFLYFESKQALFRAVVQEAVVPHLAAGEALVEAADRAPAQLLPELLRRYWQVLGDARLAGIPKLVMAEAGNFPEVAAFYHENVVQRGRALFMAVLERGMQSGEFRVGDPLVLCHLAIAPLMFSCMWRQTLACCDTESIDPEIFVQTHLDMFMRGLLADPAGERKPE